MGGGGGWRKQARVLGVDGRVTGMKAAGPCLRDIRDCRDQGIREMDFEWEGFALEVQKSTMPPLHLRILRWQPFLQAQRFT